MKKRNGATSLKPARLFHALGRGFGKLGATLRKPKWRHGGYGAALLVVVLAVGVLLNVGVSSLENTYGWRLDYSFNGYTLTGEETQKVVKALPSPVELYLLYQSDGMDSQLYEVLERYGRLSPQITVKAVDIAQNPGLLSRFQGTLKTTLEADSVIVNCDATGRYKVMGYDDFVTQGYNVEKGTFEIAGLAYEKRLTEALVYVTQTDVPMVGVLQGHGRRAYFRTDCGYSAVQVHRRGRHGRAGHCGRDRRGFQRHVQQHRHRHHLWRAGGYAAGKNRRRAENGGLRCEAGREKAS